MGLTRVTKGDNVIVQKGPDKGEILKVVENGHSNTVRLSNGEWYFQSQVSGTRQKTTK